jgi:hypothetical protein
MKEVCFKLLRSTRGSPRRPAFRLNSIIVVSACLIASCSIGKDSERSETVPEKLKSLPYVSWNSANNKEVKGVALNDREKAQPGLNLYNSLARTQAFLTDMDGTVLHDWSRDTGKEWGHVELRPNGDLFVLNEEPRQLIRMNWSSEIIWSRDIGVDHDIDFADNGDIYILTAVNEYVDYDGESLPIRIHYIEVLSEDGRCKARISLYDLLRDQLDMEALARFVATKGESSDAFRFMGDFVDAFHANTLAIVRSTYNEIFRKGFVLICVRSLDLIGVVDIEHEKLVWSWGPGVLDWPHQPVLEKNGNVLIFDNGANRKYSRIVELAPQTGEIVWEYRGEPPGSFFSIIMGGVQPLPNGNLLITESIRGHAFEITRSGEKVWEFYNPDVDEEKGNRATLYRMTRIPFDYLESRLRRELGL